MKLGQMISNLQKLQELCGEGADTNCQMTSLDGVWRESYQLDRYNRRNEIKQEWSVKLDCPRDEASLDTASALAEIRQMLGPQPACMETKPVPMPGIDASLRNYRP